MIKAITLLYQAEDNNLTNGGIPLLDLTVYLHDCIRTESVPSGPVGEKKKLKMRKKQISVFNILRASCFNFFVYFFLVGIHSYFCVQSLWQRLICSDPSLFCFLEYYTA